MTARGRNVEAVYPLTPAQAGILFHVVYENSPSLYVQQYSVALEGPIDPMLLKRAWDLVIGRHQAMRALFIWEGRERPLQIIRSSVEPEWIVEDWRATAAGQQAEALDAFLTEDRQRGFRLDQAPLMRFGLFRLTDRRYRFVWSHHHLILDGWSLGLVMKEVIECYTSLQDDTPVALPPPARFGSFIEWLEDRNESDREDVFWRRYLDGFDRTNLLPHLGIGRHERWARSQAEISHPIAEELRVVVEDFGRRHALTLSTVMRAAWALVLSRYTGDDDVVFGSTFSGRPTTLPGSLDTVGLFLNTLPVRIRIDAENRIEDWLQRIQQDQATMTDFESNPLAEVKRHAAIDPDQELFESLLVIENIPDPGQMSGPFDQSDARYHQQSNYPLVALVMPGHEFRVVCLYDDERFTPAFVTNLLRHFEAVINEICTRPYGTVGEIDFFAPRDLARVLIDWNRAEFEIPHASILDMIEPHFRSARNAPAAVSDSQRLTYGELDQRSSSLAMRLMDVGVDAGDRVVIEMARSPMMLVAMLAAMKIRAAYVPVDPDLPDARLAFILEDTDARALISRRHRSSFDVPVISIVGTGEDEPGDTPTRTVSSELKSTHEHLAYIMYTSGSTGEPKGVEVTQRNLLASTLARMSYYDAQPERYLVMSPFTFDSSVAGIYWTLATGGTLVLPEPGDEGDVSVISALIAGEQVTHLLTLPTLYEIVIEHADPANLESLDVVIVAGEPCPVSVIRTHTDRVGNARLFNEYGPTEGTVWATVERIDSTLDADRVSIGRPIPGTQVYLLDSRFRPVPVGVEGEICIAGLGVARGYLGRPELTEQMFPVIDLPTVGTTRVYRTGDIGRWTSDGRVELIGRVDHQVKIRGRRIELEEIEAHIRGRPDVHDVVVVAHEPEVGTTQLIGYFDGEIEPGDLRDFLATQLPSTMVPTHLLQLGPLPRLSNGKVDRSNLPEPELQTADFGDSVEPANEVEDQLARIWAEVLGRDAVGTRENFFELGGDSLLSIRIIARAHEAGYRITPKQFFEHPTVAEMARVVDVV